MKKYEVIDKTKFCFVYKYKILILVVVLVKKTCEELRLQGERVDP